MTSKKKPRLYIFAYKFNVGQYPIHIKYGITGDVQTRAVKLQTPVKPYFVCAINFDNIQQARAVERFLGNSLNEYSLEGEWFVFKNKEELDQFSKIFNNLNDMLEIILKTSYTEINIKKNK